MEGKGVEEGAGCFAIIIIIILKEKKGFLGRVSFSFSFSPHTLASAREKSIKTFRQVVHAPGNIISFFYFKMKIGMEKSRNSS